MVIAEHWLLIFTKRLSKKTVTSPFDAGMCYQVNAVWMGFDGAIATCLPDFFGNAIMFALLALLLMYIMYADRFSLLVQVHRMRI